MEFIILMTVILAVVVSFWVYAATNKTVVIPEPDVTPDVAPTVTPEVEVPNIDSMTKSEIETYGRTLGIELDRRKTRAKMIAELESQLK